MMMTPRQKQLVQESFALLAPVTEQAVAALYSRLFELDPDLRSLFRSDMRQQGRRMIQILAVTVLGLDYFERLVPVLQDLGRRHVQYGVVPEQYAVVEQAFIWMLEQTLADALTPETQAAWVALYRLLADTMQSGLTEPA